MFLVLTTKQKLFEEYYKNVNKIKESMFYINFMKY